MKYPIRNSLIVFFLCIVGLFIFNFRSFETKLPMVEYSTFLGQLNSGKIKSVDIRGGRVKFLDTRQQEFQTYCPDTATLLPKLEAGDLAIRFRPEPKSSPFVSTTLPLLLIMGAWIFWSKQRQGMGNSTKQKSSLVSDQLVSQVSFLDVAGIDEAKEELMETVEFLKDSSKYTRLGGRIPKGVLLQGPPGTGKTLLAKAIAGEAGVPFFSLSGSDFVEMYVGVGASRVRTLFEDAKKSSPAIIFIDEIDAVGRSRGGPAAQGGSDEREQTLNALLVEMDGFQSDETVIIVGATNRPDVLDPALLRPGRFDRQVTILPPDVKGRAKILAVHGEKLCLAPDLNIEGVAKSTPGFTGAELANLMNEAALMAARKEKDLIDLSDIEEAKDKIMMGAERKGMVVNDMEKQVTAYHEAGHAIVAKLLPEADPVHKITIIPRGRAMGVTQQVPLDDRHSYSREYLLNRIKILLGGRTAEEIVFNRFTTGASNDLQKVADISNRMVCEWGMSSALGPRAYMVADQGFLDGASQRLVHSEEVAKLIDSEINKIIEDCYQETMIILQGKEDFLHQLAAYLIEHETIDGQEVETIMQASG